MRSTSLLVSGGTQNYWGDGSDGDLVTSGNVSLASTTDGDMVVKQYASLTINTGHTLTVANRCKGLVIYVHGDCTINGTLSMTARGASASAAAAGDSAGTPGLKFPRFTASGTDTYATASSTALANTGSALINTEANQKRINGNGTIFTLSRNAGGAGGVGDGASSGSGGSGGAGTCFSGGAGSGSGFGSASAAGSANGGAGGAYSGAAGVDGKGNPSGGTGGTIILIVKGVLTIGATGSIVSKGTDADYVPAGTGGLPHALSGGASGGGNILVLFAEGLNNNGTISTAGGLRNTLANPGFTGLSGAGGANGFVQTAQIKK